MAVISGSNPFPTLSTHNNSRGGTGSDREALRDMNALIDGLQNMLIIQAGDGPVTTGAPSRGTTVTMAAAAQVITIGGVPVTVAAETAKAFGSLGTIPQNKWGVIAVDRVANATTTFVSGAHNYDTGYDSEALALAATPAKTASKARTGLITVMSTNAAGWVAGTDALQGGTGGNPATATNYYNVFISGVNQGLGYADLAFWQVLTSATSSLISSAVVNTLSRLANDQGFVYAPGVY